MIEYPVQIVPPEAEKFMVAGQVFTSEEEAAIHSRLMAAIEQFNVAIRALTVAISEKCCTADGAVFSPHGHDYYYVEDGEWPTIHRIWIHWCRYHLRVGEADELIVVMPNPRVIGASLELGIKQLYAHHPNAIAAMVERRQASIDWRQSRIDVP